MLLIEWIIAILVLLLDLDPIVHDDRIASELDLILVLSMVMLMNQTKNVADLVKDGTLAKVLKLQ